MSWPSTETAVEALRHGYKFVVCFLGVDSLGTDPYYCKTRKEAKEAAREFRKRRLRHRIVDIEATFVCREDVGGAE